MKAYGIRILFLLCVFALSASAVSAEEPLTEAKRADILRLVQVTGGAQVGMQFADGLVQLLVNNMRAVQPDLPPFLADIVKDEVMKVFSQRTRNLAELMIPIYHKHFTHEEIKGLLDFYATPLGRKVIQTLPSVVQEGMAAGQTWGQSLGPLVVERIRVRLEAEGIK